MLVTDEVRSYIGVSSEADFACDAVETGAVRRFAQAIMDEDPAYLGETNDANRRFGGPVAPPLFANHMVRRPLGTPDPVQNTTRTTRFLTASCRWPACPASSRCRTWRRSTAAPSSNFSATPATASV